MTTQLNDNIIAVEVPQDAHNFIIDDNDLCFLAAPRTGFSFAPVAYYETLPAGNYSILGLCSPTDNVQYHPLLQSKGLDLEKCYLIIEKV